MNNQSLFLAKNTLHIKNLFFQSGKALCESVLKIRFPAVGIIVSQYGNKTFPVWE